MSFKTQIKNKHHLKDKMQHLNFLSLKLRYYLLIPCKRDFSFEMVLTLKNQHYSNVSVEKITQENNMRCFIKTFANRF